MAEEKKTVFYRDRKKWRKWLSDHFESEKEIWLVFPLKSSNEEGISYNDAVEEALCFGWIDGRTGTLDDKYLLRRFTPRRKGSSYSQPNIERLIEMDRQNLIHPEIRKSIMHVIRKRFVYTDDIIDALREDRQV